MDWLIYLCIFLLGSHDWTTRERGQVLVELSAELFDCPGPLQKTAESTADAEVKRRCLRALRRYQGYVVPTGVRMEHFDRWKHPGSWKEANALPPDLDVNEYVRLLFDKEKLTRRAVGELVREAIRSKDDEEFKDAVNLLRWRAEGVMRLMNAGPPPPIY